MTKQRTFKQLWNPTALRRIRKQFEQGQDDYLCCASPEFKKIWQLHHLEIKELASRYTWKFVNAGSFGGCLFYAKESTDYTAWVKHLRKQVRIDFLTNEIKRLTTK